MRYGVLEYLVLAVREKEIHWFDPRADQQLQADPDGVFRIHVFPGLWILGEALLSRDHQRLMATLDQGLASADHAAFVAKLAAARGTSTA